MLSVHAPTLLLTQRVWSTDPWTKVDKSIELAQEVGASTVVLHPPFRWQRDYAREFLDGVALREDETGIRLAVENMFPWRARNREYQAYLPGWDPVPLPYDNVTLDLSHTATAGSDALQMAAELGHGWPTSTWPTGPDRPRTSTSCRAGAPSRVRTSWKPLRPKGIPGPLSWRWGHASSPMPSASSTSRRRWPSRGCTAAAPSMGLR